MEKISEQIPDVLLLDVDMPRMDGYELASNIRNEEHLKHIPIIMITSHTEDEYQQKASELGVDRYMGKPFDEDELLDNIRFLSGMQPDSTIQRH